MDAGKGVLPPAGADVLVPATGDWTLAFESVDLAPPVLELAPSLVRDAHGGGPPLKRLANVVLLI